MFVHRNMNYNKVLFFIVIKVYGRDFVDIYALNNFFNDLKYKKNYVENK